MYTFIFLWTPALSAPGHAPPHGFVFATFMAASMVGAGAAGRLPQRAALERVVQVRWQWDRRRSASVGLRV